MRKIPEMVLGVLFLPAPFFNESFDKELPAGGEVDHAAVVVRDERDVGNAADRDRIRDLEFTVTEVGAARAQHERKIVGDAQKFSAVHAHTDEKLRPEIGPERASQVLIFQEATDRGVPVFRRDVRELLDRNETVHIIRVLPFRTMNCAT